MPHFLIEDVVDAARRHHDAAAVQLLGALGAGLGPDRIRDLLNRGLLGKDDVTGMQAPGTTMGVDVWLLPILMGVLAASATPAAVRKMRRWPLKRWVKSVDQMLRDRVPSPSAPPSAVGAPGPQPVPSAGKVPPPPKPPPAPPAVGGLPIPSPPQGLTPTEREAWVQARTRGGEFIRGLGNKVDSQLRTLVRERWQGETIVSEADREKRLATREVVRELTADAVAQRKTIQDLASDLGHATGDWARNWDRIARTELQGAYNEGVVIDAVRHDGPDALVARIPEAGACEACRRVFLQGGIPRVFKVRELVANGTNVGRKARDWKPTIWPVHPNCRCDTQAVPPGMVFDENWLLKPAKGL